MIPIAQADLRIRKLSTLAPGQLFMYDLVKPGQLAIAMAQEDGRQVFLGLTGKFELVALNKGQDRNVLDTGLNASNMVLRIDFASASTNYGEHTPGQLIVGDDDGPCIAAVWPSLSDRNYHNVVMLQDWSQSAEAYPRYIFDRWSLGQQFAGEWIDVVSRS